MKINLVFLTFLLCGGFLITGCEKSNGTIYQVKEECQDGGCKGRFGAWYIKNTSYDKTIRFIIQVKEIDASGKENLDTLDETLDPGEFDFIGCMERDCGLGWVSVSYNIVGEQIQQ